MISPCSKQRMMTFLYVILGVVLAMAGMGQGALAVAKENHRVLDPPKRRQPHLILLLADDFGWANVGFHRSDGSKEVQTPNLDFLASSGVILDRFYTYKICSPSRSSLQSGRLPVHVNTVNMAPEAFNPRDLVSGYSGIPRNMTCLAEKLKTEGYRTFATGKWDAGMATPRHTPKGRGYDDFLGYFHHANNYWDYGLELPATGEIDVCGNQLLDIWTNKGPFEVREKKVYEEELFELHTIERGILAHDTSSAKPLFLFHSFHLCHTPLQVPDQVLKLFSFIEHSKRRRYAAMAYHMDRTVGRIVDALKSKRMYDESLILFFSDNGGPVYDPGSANNWPLRGGKYSDFEGGIRVNAIAAGGIIPSSRRGSVSHDLIHISDVYATFIRLAHFGYNTPKIDQKELAKVLHDRDAESANLPPVDAKDTVWQAIVGSGGDGPVGEIRAEIHISTQCLIQGRYKLIVGRQGMDMHQGPYFPNSTGPQPLFPDIDIRKKAFYKDCGPAGCLFDVFADPTEQIDLASSVPQLRKQMLDRLAELNKSEFAPNRGRPMRLACHVGHFKWKGHYGPFLELESFGEAGQELIELDDEELDGDRNSRLS